MAHNGIHLIALLEADLLDEDIPAGLLTDWRGVQREWAEMEAEARDLESKQIHRRARMRFGRPDPYPELDEEP
jgi:hypothetical protein